jgi:hypothetical protein
LRRTYDMRSTPLIDLKPPASERTSRYSTD